MTTENSIITSDQLWSVYQQMEKALRSLTELSELTPDECWNYHLLKMVADQHAQAFKAAIPVFASMEGALRALPTSRIAE